MIIRTEIDGRSCAVQYLTRNRIPTTEAEAEMIYVIFDDGERMWGYAPDETEDADKTITNPQDADELSAQDAAILLNTYTPQLRIRAVGPRRLPAQDAAPIDLKVNIRPVGPPQLGQDKGEWDEEKHPRGQPENAGEFAKIGGPKAEKASPTRVQGFVSPSVASHLSFTEARSGLTTQAQRQLARVSSHIDKAMGVKAVRQNPAIGAWSDGAENSLALSFSKIDLPTARAVLAMKGYLANQKAVLLFQPDKEGKEAMMTFSVYGDLQDIHNNLLKHGVAFHTLEPLKSGDGAKVHVYATDQATVDAVGKVTADVYGVPLNHVYGKGEFIGTDKSDGTDDEQRADARRVYEAVIREAEDASPLGRKLGGIWRDARNNWGAAAKAAATGRIDPLPNSKGGSPAQISTRRPAKALPYEDEYRRADMDGWKEDPEQFSKTMRLLDDREGYPNLRPEETKGDPDKIARAVIDHAKANLRFLYDHAPEALKKRGHQWYEGAHDIAVAAARKHKLPLQSVVGVYASQSPQKLWDMNVYLGDKILDIYQHEQHTAWDETMEQYAPSIWKNDKSKKRDAELKRLLSLVRGKTLAECDNSMQKALWIRTYHEAHNPDRPFPEVSPDGKRGKPYEKKDGKPAKTAWNSTAMIAAAVDCIESNGDRDVISDAMGDKHKVRSFYNNILDPHSPNEDVTMDTHAVGAALLRPVSGHATSVIHSLGSTPQKEKPPGWVGGTASSTKSGVDGTYALYAEAYRELAAELSEELKIRIEPRTLQSITWEAKRSMFSRYFTDKQAAAVDQAWKDYHDGKAELKATQEEILKIAGPWTVKGY